MGEDAGAAVSDTATLLRRAIALSGQGDFAASIQLLDQALALDASNVDLLLARGTVRRQCEEWELAIADFSQAALLRHDLHRAYFERAQTYTAMAGTHLARGDVGPGAERLKLAIRDYSTAFRIQPEARYLIARAIASEKAQIWSDALADYDRVLAVCRPSDPQHQDAVDGKHRVAPKVLTNAIEPAPRVLPDAAPGFTGHAALLQARKEALQTYGSEEKEGATPIARAQASEAWTIARQIVDAFFNGEPIEYVTVQVQSFVDLASAQYDSLTEQLWALGFRALGDFEPLHLTRRVGTRVLARLLVDARARTLVCVRQRQPLQFDHGKSWAARLLARHPAPTIHVEFETEMADGRFIVTNNDKGHEALSFPPQVDMLRMMAATAVSDLWQVHAERIRHYKAAHAPMTEVPVRGEQQAFALQERRRAVTMAFRIAGGGLNGDELKTVLGTRYAALGAAVRAEIADMLATMKDRGPD
jgi:tetratricopeptide (TPR) repeat protein